ncbi:MAG: protein kinase domain-containing protein [Friedmanniella sp.]
MLEHPQVRGLDQWQPLARGGLAIVWRARQLSLDRLVAVEVYARRLDDAAGQRRFLRESAAAGRLSGHAGVVTVHDAGILPDGRPYLVMELAPGGSLTGWLGREDQPDEEQVRQVGVRIADALATAHAAGVLHRDVKPANVLIDAYGDPGLADFGLAAVVEPEMELADETFGVSPAYAPPEVLRGRSATTAGDVFSLAATLYALLAGRPFREVTPDSSTPAQLALLADRPVRTLPGVHWRFMTALTAALSDDPAARPTAAEFRDELRALQLSPARRQARPAAAAPAGHVRPRRRRRVTRLVPLAILAALFASGGIVTAWTVSRPVAPSAAGASHPTTVGSAVSSAASPPAGTDTGSASRHSAGNAAAVAVLAGCRTQVRASDAVVRQAAVGIGHWAAHVQAQTDANAGRIPAAELQGRFKRTRLAGPADVSRYQRALAAHAAARGTCRLPPGAPADVRAAVRACSARARAQTPVLAAASAGMADWEHHLADMQRSRSGHVHNAQTVWIRTWRAAPPHIRAWQQALARLRAPHC